MNFIPAPRARSASCPNWSWEYDGSGNLVRAAKEIDAFLVWERNLQNTYDGEGRLTEVLTTFAYGGYSDHEMTREIYIWDGDILVSIEGDWDLDGTDWVVSFERDASGNAVYEETLYPYSDSMNSWRHWRDFDGDRVAREETWFLDSNDDWAFYELVDTTWDLHGMETNQTFSSREDLLPTWEIRSDNTYDADGRLTAIYQEAYEPYHWDEHNDDGTYYGGYRYGDGESVLEIISDEVYTCP